MMKLRNWGIWGIGGICGAVGAVACSGSVVHDVGNVNGGDSGRAGSNNAGANAVGGALHSGGSNDAGANTGGEDDVGANNGGSGGIVTVGGNGGTGGIFSAGGPNIAGSGPIVEPGGEGGEGGGVSVDYPLTCPACTAITAADARDVTTTDQKVYWVEYGTNDSLHNYEYNGRLLARDLAGGAASVIADSLPGPVSVSVSQNFAYLVVERRPEVHKAGGVLRVPLAGGAPQLLQTADTQLGLRFHDLFSPAPGYTYWAWEGAVYRVAEVGAATVEAFLPYRGINSVINDGSRLYFQDTEGTWSVPLAGGVLPTELSVGYDGVFQVSGEYLYGASADYLTRLPKAGGVWKRIAKLKGGSAQIAIDGDSYFRNVYLDDQTIALLQGSISAPSTQYQLASQHFRGWHSWALSSVGIFIASTEGLQLTPTK